MKKLRIHYFQHVAFESLGSIEEWISLSGHSLTSTRFFERAKLPEIADIDWLIVMGGGMSVHDEEQFPWLADEKKFIRQAIDAGQNNNRDMFGIAVSFRSIRGQSIPEQRQGNWLV